MKLAVITRYWKKSDGGGVRVYTENLVSHLIKRNIDVIVLFVEGEDENNFKLSPNKVKFILEAKKVLMKEKPDTILCMEGWYTDVPALFFKRKYKNTKLLALFLTHFDSKMPTYKKLSYESIFSRFDKVGFISDALREDITNIAGLNIKTDTFILHPGVSVNYPSKDEVNEYKKRFNIEQRNIYLLGSGLTAYHSKKEGAKLLMRALSNIIKKHPEVRLILTRKGEYSKELKEYSIDLGLKDHIIFTGDLKNPYVSILTSDIYTHITYGEGLPIALLESMAFGKPIVATNRFGIPEAIINQKDGILVNNEVNEIENAIINLIEDKNLQEELGKNAKKTVDTKFTWDNTAEKFLRLYKEGHK